MLTHLQLRDLVIVDAAELEFGEGLIALTGETGAGKSLVVDALSLVAGGRASGDVVRQGAERAEVTASFTGLPAAARAWLEAQSIDAEDEVIVRRVIGADGRSRAFINGQLVPIQALRELGDHLLEIHGQQEFLHLLKRDAQRGLLDDHLGDPSLVRPVADAFAAHRDCQREFQALSAAAADRDARLDLLRYQVTELKSEVGTVADLEELFAEQKRLAGRGRLAEAARQALGAVYEADADTAHDLLARAHAALRPALDLDGTLEPAAKLVAEAAILAQEAGEALRRYLESLDVDPTRQDEIERRAAALEGLARKHRVAVLALPEVRDRLEGELAKLENAATTLGGLQQRLEDLARGYRAAATKLTAGRRRAAESLGRQITDLMQTLGMAGGRFVVEVRAAAQEFAAHGADEVEFLVSANPGQAPKPLAKVASGGELSRISLAVQVAAAARSAPLCRVFDEVDAGIGGRVAEIVGRRLRELGERSQVFCVTHLPQVAAQGHRQFRVLKLTDGKTTRTAVAPLGPEERVEEIARMLAGVDVTDPARAHAREMLSLAAGTPPQPAKANARESAGRGRSRR